MGNPTKKTAAKKATTSTAAPKNVGKKMNHPNIYAALSAFQGELKPMEKNGHVNYQKKTSEGEVDFRYTTLDKIMETIYPLLAKHGLTVRHEVTGEDKGRGIEAILVHETYKIVEVKKNTSRTFDGTKEEEESIDTREENIIRSGVIKISLEASDMKDVGTAITYARRYTLTMVLGIASEDDKDAPIREESSKNAQKFTFTKAKQSINDAKSEEELTKQMKLVDSDMQKIKDGKAPTLGLVMEDYMELQELAEVRLKEIKEDGEDQSKK